jgi:hypothetical protein
MALLFSRSPRYRLADELRWLEGIDPGRHYWMRVNSDPAMTVALPGLCIDTLEEFKSCLWRFRDLQPGEQMPLTRIAPRADIHCISENCYAIASQVCQAPVWHLFDRATLESLLMTAHPDWQCSAKDLELGRRALTRCWKLTVSCQG